MTPKLEALRSRLTSDGWTATSPRILDDEAEQMARADRADYEKD